MELIQYNKCTFEKTALTLADDLTPGEWKQIGAGLKQIEGSIQFWIGDWARYGEKKGFYTDSKVYDELEEITGLERKTLRNYTNIAGNVQSSRRRDDVGFSHHAEVAKLPPEKQEIFLTKAANEKLSVRELREEIRRDEIAYVEDVEMPQDKYRVIYADPPWKYGNSMPSYFSEQANHYPLMTMEEICNMPVSEIAQDNAVLFLWVTSPILEESFRVVNAWGFKYKSSFIWDKIKHNMGHYNSVRHEILLICTRGSCQPDIQKLYDSVQSIERTRHSEKPEAFREIIDTIYTNGKRIEIFARKNAKGWAAYGNQILQEVS